MSNPRNPKLTAKDIKAELQNDSEHQRRRMEKQARHQAGVDRNRAAAAPVLDDLERAGFAVASIPELTSTGAPYPAAVPVLLRWLPLIQEADVKESIVRALSVPWAKPAAARPLIAEYQRVPGGTGLKWAIGNALEAVADDSVFDDIASLLRNRDHGKDREMLAVALGRMKDPRASTLAVELLDDEMVVGHALIAVGKLKVLAARAKVDALLEHPQNWVRKEAKKALKKISG
jgi:hypothetical protein